MMIIGSIAMLAGVVVMILGKILLGVILLLLGLALVCIHNARMFSGAGIRGENALFNGFGKRTELTEYLRTGPNGEKIAQGRGGKGLKNYNITAKTGNVAGCRVVGENDDVMLIENGGVIIRIPASSINIYKRDVQGVIVMRIEEGNQVVSLERVENMEETEETAEA